MIHERTLEGATDPRTLLPPLVLVADEDEAIRDLLHLAFSSQRWRVITAADGDEALQRTIAERPDMVVLAHPLPRKSGLEVCDYLRHDPEDPNIPVVLLAQLADAELRLEALQRGADEVLSKPFSPRELLARGRRLLIRSQDARRLRREQRELERELTRAREGARRAQQERDHEHELRVLASGLGRELHDRLSSASVGSHLLLAARTVTGASGGALYLRDPDTALWQVAAHAGAAGTRLARLPVEVLAMLEPALIATGRPRLGHELTRGTDRSVSSALAAAGLAIAVPLASLDGLEGALLLAERSDGHPHTLATRESMGVLGMFASSALRAVRRYESQSSAMLDLAIRQATRPERERLAAEAASRAVNAAAMRLGLEPASRRVLVHAAAAGAWGWSEAGARTLAALAERDVSGLARSVQRLVAAAQAIDVDAAGLDPRAVTLAAVAARAVVVRASGRSERESWLTALAWTAPVADARAVETLREDRLG